jgi:hypothetical protein
VGVVQSYQIENQWDIWCVESKRHN